MNKGILLFLFLLSICRSSIASTTDSAEVHGKFIKPCQTTGMQFREYNLMGSSFVDVLVSNGEFTFHVSGSEPRQIYLKVGDSHFEFLVTPKEKTYSIEITCDEKGQQTVAVKNSVENDAFRKFIPLSRSLRDTLEKFSKSDLARKDTFTIIKKIFADYQNKIREIIKEYPETFTGNVLCPSELLPESAFVSIASLRKSYLQRDAFSNSQVYNNFYLSRLITNYISLSGQPDTAFAPMGEAITIALKNTQSAKYLEEIYYDYFYGNKKEQLLVKFIDWADHHPEGMVNFVTKAQLQNLKKAIAGATFSEIHLNDPSGNNRLLSEEIAGSKLTLLIFYSPTCSHCRENLPKLVPLWESYKKKGFRIFAVSFDAKKDEWDEFIKTYSTQGWTNVMEPSNGVKPSLTYVVTYTPSFILIDHDGKIITRFADVDYLMKEIPERLGKN